MHLSSGGDRRVEIGGASLVGSVVVELSLSAVCFLSFCLIARGVVLKGAFVSPELFVAECCLFPWAAGLWLNKLRR